MTKSDQTSDHAPVFFVALVEVHDPAGFQEYHRHFEATLAPFGGNLVSFGATIVPLAGFETATARAAIVLFPNMQAATEWFASPAYQRIAPIRERTAKTLAFYVQGLPLSTKGRHIP
jgi:uncharacterized protein (DUF1330 family)